MPDTAAIQNLIVQLSGFPGPFTALFLIVSASGVAWLIGEALGLSHTHIRRRTEGGNAGGSDEAMVELDLLDWLFSDSGGDHGRSDSGGGDSDGGD